MRTIDSRTGLEVLDRDHCLQLLGHHMYSVGRLALVDGSHPLILPINYAMDEDRIVFRTAAGTKVDAAVRGANVAFEIDHFDDETHTGWSVLVKGRAELVQAKADLQRLATLALRPWAEGEKANWVSIRAESIGGRKVTNTGHFFW